MKNHHLRDDDPLGAKRIDKHQRIAVWLRPPRPDWMSQQEYDELPAQVEIRLVDVIIEQAGFRSKKYTIATTILETKVYSRQWLTSVYRSRWLVELDIRSIKCSLGLDIVRAKTPSMVKTEIWSCMLAYNLIRMKMLQGGALNGRMPRTLSFVTAMQTLATSWVLASVILTCEMIQMGVQSVVSEQVGNRLDRIEPRANKRRRKFCPRTAPIAPVFPPRMPAIAVEPVSAPPGILPLKPAKASCGPPREISSNALPIPRAAWPKSNPPAAPAAPPRPPRTASTPACETST